MSLPSPWQGGFGRADTRSITALPLDNPVKNIFREKRWCYAGVVSPDLFLGAAVVHLGYITSAFCFFGDGHTRQMVEKTLTLPPLGHTRFDRNPESGAVHFKVPGFNVQLTPNPQTAGKTLKVRFQSKGIRITADLALGPFDTGFHPMHFPMDMGYNKTAFTTKAAGLGVQGRIQVGEKQLDLSTGQAWGLFDWTHGAYPRQTFWNWACAAGKARDDTGTSLVLGFNFSRGVYENGRLENTLWVNGIPEPIDAVGFAYDSRAPETPWNLQSQDQKVQLTFTPLGMRRANDNLGMIASRFIQPWGLFKGRLITRDGRTLHLKNIPGVVEEHYAKW